MMHASLTARRRGFQIHAFVFVATMLGLTALNLTTGAPYWFYWPLFGWGVGLCAHWFFVLGPGAGDSSSGS